MVKSMYDAIVPNAGPSGWPVAAGYIPGGDAYRGWTDQDWRAEKARYRLPIWVRSNPRDSVEGINEGHAAVAWAIRHGQPKGTTIALDLELAVHPAYVNAFNVTLFQAGYLTMAYGSLSTIFGNPHTHGGYWVAHYTGVAHMENGADATQYANHGAYDASLIKDSVPLWDTQSHPTKVVELQSGNVNMGAGAMTMVAVAPGEHAIAFAADNGKLGKLAPSLRVAVSRNGVWDVTPTVVVDSHKGATVIKFTNPANTDAVSIVQNGDGSVPIGWVVY